MYRGLSQEGFDAVVGKAKTGDTIQSKGFVSTTLNPAIAKEFASGEAKVGVKKSAGVLLEIKAKRGLYSDGDSKMPKEMELIQAHETKYKYIGMTEGKDGVRIAMLEKI